MRLRSVDGIEQWVLSEEEKQSLQEQRTRDEEERGSPPGDLAEGTVSRIGARAQTSSARTPGEGIRLPARVGEELSRRGWAVFKGEDIEVPPSIVEGFAPFHRRFEQLAYQEFGRPGARGFFAGRLIAAGIEELPPGSCEEGAAGGDFGQQLLRATVRSLPGYRSDRAYVASCLLARHPHSVDAMPVHRDDVGWLAQFNIERTPGVRGGAIQLLDADGRVHVETILAAPLDGYIVRDADFRHGVTAMTMTGPVDHRDVFIIRLPETGT